jgi:4'-phosphopantetheinyl transferase
MGHSGDFDLRDGQIHVWSFPAAAPASAIAELLRTLSPDERQRANQFRLEHLRDSFVVTRGVVRHLLGRYLRLSSAAIRFDYGPKGKPALAPVNAFRFNVTHSGGLAAIALTAGCEIGFDLEQLRAIADLHRIAERFFRSEEAAGIVTLPPEQQISVFFRCWTRKEAYLKASGDGLFTPLDRFTVTEEAPESARPDSSIERKREIVTIEDLCIAPGYASAVAYHDRKRPITIFPTTAPEELLQAT